MIEIVQWCNCMITFTFSLEGKNRKHGNGVGDGKLSSRDDIFDSRQPVIKRGFGQIYYFLNPAKPLLMTLQILKTKTMFARDGSILFGNEMKPFYWSFFLINVISNQ